MKKTKAHAVIAYSWNDPYDSGYQTIMGVFESKEYAEEFIEQKEKAIPVFRESLYRLTSRIRDSSYHYVIRNREIEYNSDAFWEEVQRIEDKLLEKAYEKYPGFTDNEYDVNVSFKIVEVDYYKED